MGGGAMEKGVNIIEAISRTCFLEGRTPKTSPEDEAKAFSKLADYREGAIFAGGFSGQSPWECHSQGDEIICVIDGEATVTILDNVERVVKLEKGVITVVPKNAWHQINAPKGVTLITVTPLPTSISYDKP